jgi:hypothetical protein
MEVEMNRKTLFWGVVVALALTLLAVTASTTLAQGPDRPGAAPQLKAVGVPANGPFANVKVNKADRAQAEARLQESLASLESQLASSPLRPSLDTSNRPAAVAAAAALKESLSAEQKAQAQKVLARFEGELKALGDEAMALGKPSAPLKGKQPAAGLQKLVGKMDAMAARIDRELSKILSGDQLANHRAALQVKFDLTNSTESPAVATPDKSDSPSYNLNGCWYASYYESIGKWYKYYAYIYAYYNYVYYDDSYDYYAYYYSYLGYYYGNIAIGYIAGAYIEGYYAGYDWQNDGYYGQYYGYYGYYYAYYGYLYSYYSYVYGDGSAYAYYAQYYGYYAQYWNYYGYLYAYYYCD